MPIQILMPALSPTMTEGNLAKWHKKAGDKIKAGEVIAEIETDKATMEVEAVDEGTLGKILVAEGTQAVKVNTAIAVLLEEGESTAAMDNMVAPAPKAAASLPAAAPVQTKAQPVHHAAAGERIAASPLAKRVAEQNNIDLRQVSGSGPHGRIIRADVENAAPVSAAAPAAYAPVNSINAAALADALGQRYVAVPNSQVRRVIAKRLLESKQTIPHFYLTIDCALDKLLAMRAEINAAGDVKISVNDFIIKAVAKALQKIPAANVSWSEDAILQYQSVDIAVAVAAPQGLVTPIIKAAHTRTLSDISGAMKDLAARARDNKLRPEEFQGGGFTISNLGMYGISHFAAIINPPQACILAIGAGEQKPVVKDGKIEIATIMSVTLSADHRAVDGAVGAQFMQAFKQFIESPALILA
jgi:pyruvate dehydrogenase E2 component (dihydrolipoamide acetyltransferase)